MKYIITTLLFLISYLTSQTGDWSPALQLSRDGVGPYEFMGVPAITVDHNGTIHAFWVSSPSPDGSVTARYSQIEYRKSTDGGLTWSTTENLTPDYTTERISYMKAICDSQNNVHLVYMRGNEGYEVLYKKYEGVSWTEPELIGYGSSYLRMNIDSDDRIYATWMIGREAYFSYCDDGIWSDYEQIGTGEYGISSIKFDDDNILYSTGTCWTDVKPYLFIYDKLVENWIKIEQIPCDPDSSSGGNAISFSREGELFINYSQGSYNSKNEDIHIIYNVASSEYSGLYKYSDNNNPEKEMFVDVNNYIHLFELHYYTGGDTTDDMGLLHNIGKSEVWETVVIDSSDENFSFSSPYIAYDKINNKFFLLYKQSDKIYTTSRIFFRSKLNTTGIEDNNDLIVDDFRLEQNYPNPFNNQTKISYNLSQICKVELSVFNPKGQIVALLVRSKQNKGNYSVSFNADKLNSGVYYYQLKTDGILRSIKRMIYLK